MSEATQSLEEHVLKSGMRSSRRLWWLAAAFAVSSCSGDGPTGNGPPVASITVSPAPASVQVGRTVQLTAVVTDGQGNPLSGRRVFWSSGDTLIAKVDQNGVVTGIAVGTTNIAASSEGQGVNVTLTVNPKGVARITISPTHKDLRIGGSSQLTATTFDENDNVITGRGISWSSSDLNVVAVDATGRITGLATGSATITAESEGVSTTATVSVTPVPVGSVTVSPTSARIFIGTTTQLTANLRDTTNTPITGRAVSWQSSNTNVATVDNNGLVTGVGVGTATISATSEGVSGTASVSVSVIPVGSVILSPNVATLTPGQTKQLTTTITDAAGQILTGRPVSWSSDNNGVATVSSSGLVTAVGPGTATITATSEGKTGTAVIIVAAAPVASVKVSPSSDQITVGETTQFSVTLKDADGNVLTNRTIVWASSNTAVATVNPTTGLVTGVSPGSVTITATSEGVTDNAHVNVSGAPVASVTVSPSPASVTVGLTTQLSATVKDVNGTVVTDRIVTWASDNENVATVDQNGLVTGVAAGSATITATSEGKSGNTTAAVADVPVASVSVDPSSATIVVGDSVQLTATTKDGGGNTLSGRSIDWSSSDNNVATVSTDGWVVGVSAGTVTITATSEGVQGTASVTVDPSPTVVTSLTVSPASATLSVGQSEQLVATPYNAYGDPVEGKRIDWSSSDGRVASVDDHGVVKGKRSGLSTITAGTDGHQASASVTVNGG